MKKFAYPIVILFLAIIMTSCTKSPDVVYYNGKIYSIDENNNTFEAVAVKDGKILELGKSDEFKNKYSKAKFVDLQGKTVLPGFIDAEANMALFTRYLSYIQLEKFNSKADLKKNIIEKAGKFKEGTWIGVFYFGELKSTADSIIEIDKKFLDETAPNHNVFIYYEFEGNRIALCNSKMLNTLRITPKTESPEFGEIGLDANNELDGFLYDDAVTLIDDKYRTTSKEEMLSSVELACKELTKFGITAIHDRYVNRDNLAIYRQLIDSSKFPLKLYAVLSVIQNDDTYKEYLLKGPEPDYKGKLSIRALTIDYDGMFERQIAVMKDEYQNEPKRQVSFSSDEEIEDAIKSANENKFQIRIKAVGDKSVNSVLNAMERVNPDKNLRPMIEHIEFISKEDIGRLKMFNILPSVRPEYVIKDIEILPKIIRKENITNIGLWKSMLGAAGKIISGSDFPIKNPNPFVQLYYLINRHALNSSDNGALPNERLSVIEAIKTYTIWSAYAAFDEEERGSLEKGKNCDFIVLSDDIFNTDVKKIVDIKVLKTIIGGEIVFSLD